MDAPSPTFVAPFANPEFTGVILSAVTLAAEGIDVAGTAGIDAGVLAIKLPVSEPEPKKR